jgi:sporulation protein YlmC with PRC-barrel domain
MDDGQSRSSRRFVSPAGYEEQAMDVTIGAHVIDQQGHKAGEVSTVVVDAHTQAVTHVVVSKGWLLPRDKVVPVEALEAVRPHELRLRLNEKQIAQLPDFYTHHYISPAEDEEMTASYAPGSYLYQPALPAVGVGWMMPYVEPDTMQPVDVSEADVPPDSIVLSEGMDVWAENEKVGTLAGVRLDPRTEQVSHLIISHGWLFHTEQVVPRSTVRAIDDRGIHLNLTRDALRSLGQSSSA